MLQSRFTEQALDACVKANFALNCFLPGLVRAAGDL